MTYDDWKATNIFERNAEPMEVEHVPECPPSAGCSVCDPDEWKPDPETPLDEEE